MKGNTIAALPSYTLLPKSIVWLQQKSPGLKMPHMWSAECPTILVFEFQNDNVLAKTLWSLPMDFKSVLLEMDKEKGGECEASCLYCRSCPPHTNMIGPEAAFAGPRPWDICLIGGALDLCITNHHLIFGYPNVAAYCSSNERAWEWRILLIILSLPALQVSDDLIGVTCS